MSWEPLRGLTLAIYFVERFLTKISPKAILVFFVPKVPCGVILAAEALMR